MVWSHRAILDAELVMEARKWTELSVRERSRLDHRSSNLQSFAGLDS